eukprot:1773947-Amphidinium_carterae.2
MNALHEHHAPEWAALVQSHLEVHGRPQRTELCSAQMRIQWNQCILLLTVRWRLLTQVSWIVKSEESAFAIQKVFNFSFKTV